MKIRFLIIIVVAILALVGCQGNDTQEGRTNDRDTNIEQTRYNDNKQNRMNTRDRTEDRRDNSGTRTRDNSGYDDNRRDGGDNQNRYDVSKEAADKITDQIDEIDYAYVITTNNNAYVAAVLDNDHDRNRTTDRNNDRRDNNQDSTRTDEGEELTEDVKEEISDIVRSVDNDIDNVYVSTNPDFADLTNNYINDMNEGRPIRGMFDQIGNMIERLFPQDRQ